MAKSSMTTARAAGRAAAQRGYIAYPSPSGHEVEIYKIDRGGRPEARRGAFRSISEAVAFANAFNARAEDLDRGR